MMNKEYWEEYWRTHEVLAPSSFAQWVAPRVTGQTLYNIGSGNGRDSYELNYLFDEVIDIDPAGAEGGNLCTFEEFAEENECRPDSTVYARWFIHAVDAGVEEKLLSWTKGQLFIEARAYGGDHPTDHYRRPIVMEYLLQDLIDHNYNIDYAAVSDKFSIQGDDQPLLLRVEAHRWT